MSRMRPECLDPDLSDRLVAAAVLVREESDEEDDEEDDREEGDDIAWTLKTAHNKRDHNARYLCGVCASRKRGEYRRA